MSKRARQKWIAEEHMAAIGTHPKVSHRVIYADVVPFQDLHALHALYLELCWLKRESSHLRLRFTSLAVQMW